MNAPNPMNTTREQFQAAADGIARASAFLRALAKRMRVANLAEDTEDMVAACKLLAQEVGVEWND